MHKLSKHSWFAELQRIYVEIVTNPNIPTENLDKANEIICEAIEKLRPLAKS